MSNWHKETGRKAATDQRTRERLPILPVLVHAAAQRLQDTRARLDAVRAAAPCQSVSVSGSTFTKAMHGAQTTCVYDPAERRHDMALAGWPDCGEIDIMENVGNEPSTLYGTIHGPGYHSENGPGGSTASPDGRPLADAFHTYAVEWLPDSISWFVDGKRYLTLTPADIPSGRRWVFDHPFFMLLNVAVGGTWPGNPGSSTTFPQQLTVDYIRVYQAA